MANIEVKNTATKLTGIAIFGIDLAQVFHNYALIAPRIPTHFEGSINIIDATVTTINQLVSLLTNEVTEIPAINNEGLKYVELLGTECAVEIARIQLAVIKASTLEPKSHKGRYRRGPRHLLKLTDYVSTSQIEITAIKLADDFLVAVENANWDRIPIDLDNCIERLHELQLHLLLVFLVVTVRSLSKDVSAGKASIPTIVTFHERISRTAKLIGFKCTGRITSSSSDSSGSDSEDSYAPRRRRFGPPPPPPPPPPGMPCVPGPPLPVSGTPLNASSTCSPPVSSVPIESHMPPSYAASYKPEIDPKIIQSDMSSKPGSTLEKATPCYSEEKPTIAKDAQLIEDETKAIKSAVPDGRLLKSKSTGFRFKLKNLFRTKVSLAEEMQRVLSDTQSTLTAFIIQNAELRQVPHSAFHSLEMTHMRTLLKQINDNTWYKTFTDLTDIEHETLDRITTHRCGGKVFNRDVVALKVLQANTFNAWMRLMTEKIAEDWIHPHHENHRVILAIVRERLNDRLPAPLPQKGQGSSRAGTCFIRPPPGVQGPRMPPSSTMPPVGVTTPMTPKKSSALSLIRPPPLPQYKRPNGISDPRDGPVHIPICPTRHLLASSGPYSQTDSQLALVSNYDVHMVLTTYYEFTFRLAPQSLDGSIPGDWNRVAITQESSDRDAVFHKVQEFRARGMDVIAAKLRLTQAQDGHVSRLMDDLKLSERDSRFEWSLAELSLHTDIGAFPSAPGCAASVTRMHIIAQRSPRPEHNPKELYKAICTNPYYYGPPGLPIPPPPPGPPPPGPLITINPRRYSSGDESDSSAGMVRCRLNSQRRYKVRRQARSLDSDSSDAEEERRMQKDIRIKISLKRGDDVVEKLLGLWTLD
ncbi:hypothetical protein PVAG01_01882 [Phlyctema vagabunda]|uniref:Uncharacterized protein n=1 Tax=Phlyctema vagabunda TaxID=108571 RepID=A0ABR4PYG3_9HELO